MATITKVLTADHLGYISTAIADKYAMKQELELVQKQNEKIYNTIQVNAWKHQKPKRTKRGYNKHY